MGLLSLGTPLPWDEAKKYADHVRTHGITQFLHTWDRLKGREGDELLWGDEVCQHYDVCTCCDLIVLLYRKIEYMVVSLDDVEKNAKLSLRQTEILGKLSGVCNDLSDQSEHK